MSYTSCVQPNKPGDDVDTKHLVPPRDITRGASRVLWVVGSLFVTINMKLNESLTGITVSIPVLSVLLMLVATLLLMKGLRDNCWPLVAPWVMFSLYQCHSCQYQDLMRFFYVLLGGGLGRMPWVTWLCYFATFVLRVQLTLKVVFLSVNQWYSQKLLGELLTY